MDSQSNFINKKTKREIVLNTLEDELKKLTPIQKEIIKVLLFEVERLQSEVERLEVEVEGLIEYT